MYTNDEESQKRQRESAQEYIASIARRCASQKRRIKELDYFRGVYQSFGDWQTAIDVLEEQMVAWGRITRSENAELCQQYDEEMKKIHIDPSKEEWDETDFRILGLSKAYADARYALRFMDRGTAIGYLMRREQEIRERLLEASAADIEKGRGRADGLLSIVKEIWNTMPGEGRPSLNELFRRSLLPRASLPRNRKNQERDTMIVPTPEKVFYDSTDGVRLCAVWQAAVEPARGVIVMAHGIMGGKDEPEAFPLLATALARYGFHSLRFDFRGHGESGGTQDEMTLAGEQQDLMASVAYACKRSSLPLGIVAFNLGAVAACWYAATFPRFNPQRFNPQQVLGIAATTATGQWKFITDERTQQDLVFPRNVRCLCTSSEHVLDQESEQEVVIATTVRWLYEHLASMALQALYRRLKAGEKVHVCVPETGLTFYIQPVQWANIVWRYTVIQEDGSIERGHKGMVLSDDEVRDWCAGLIEVEQGGRVNWEYDLRGVQQVRIEEEVDTWVVRGESEGGRAVSRAREEYFKDQEAQARAHAAQWCRDLGFATYVMDCFTGEPGVHLLMTIDAETGRVIEEHTEDYRS